MKLKFPLYLFLKMPMAILTISEKVCFYSNLMKYYVLHFGYISIRCKITILKGNKLKSKNVDMQFIICLPKTYILLAILDMLLLDLLTILARLITKKLISFIRFDIQLMFSNINLKQNLKDMQKHLFQRP